MKISLNWIKEFVNLDGISLKDLWYRFTMSTAEVDDVVEMGGDIRDVVVARVISVEPHPSSDKLKICMVDTGDGVVRSVCGAPNVREGILVPFAKPGGSIRNVPEVVRTEVSGVESCGILCSPMETGISDSHEGLLILDGDYRPGTNIKSIIDIDDVIVEIDNKSLTNRPDLWGHYGIAREMAAIFGRDLKPLETAENLENKNLPDIDIRLEDEEKCLRYSALCIEGVSLSKTPFNMQVRLYYCGMRSISPMVDLTNYLMLETGQPMHAFDRRLMDTVVVRPTDETIRFRTLDGIERTLPEDVLMICSNDKPVAIAGIMGGEDSEVTCGTGGILLESACFEGSSIRKNSARLGLRTEASARFEKMLDPNLTILSIKRFVKLLKDMEKDARVASNLTDLYVRPLEPISLTLDKSYIERYVGNPIETVEIENILKSLEFTVSREGRRFTVGVPSFRSTKDITAKVDIIEEISRIRGYDNILPETVQVALQPLEYNENRLAEHRFRDLLSDKFAFSEVFSYIWYDNSFNVRIGIGRRGTVTLLNPHARDMNMLRDSMAPGMLEFAELNRKAFEEFSLFEIGSVFSLSGPKDGCRERKNLCLLKCSKTKSEDELFRELKGIVSDLLRGLKNTGPEYGRTGEDTGYPWIHPVKSLDICLDGRQTGYVSVLHPRIGMNLDKKLKTVVAELDLTEVLALPAKGIRYTEPSKYPEMTLDYNFLADQGTAYDKVMGDVSGFAGDLLLDAVLLDVYTGKGLPEGKKSMTFRCTLGSKVRTLSGEETDVFSAEFVKHMEDRGYALR